MAVRGKIVFTALGFILPSLPCVAAQKSSVIALMSTDWRLAGSETLNLQDVAQWGSDPAIDREFGVKVVTLRTYRIADHTAQVLVEKAPDPSSAYGLFTFYRTEGMRREAGMELAVAGSEGALMARGVLFIRVPRPPALNISDPDFHSLLVAAGGAKPSRDDIASLPPALPPRGLVRGTTKYVLGPLAVTRLFPSIPADLIGFQQGAELESAVYKLGGERLTALALDYPTAQIAKEHFASLSRSLALDEEGGASTIYGKRKGSFVILVMNARSASAAQLLLSEFDVSTQLSWAQPPPLTERQLTIQLIELFLSNILLILMIVGSMLAAGIMLFLVRRGLAHIFPHAEWAKMDEDVTIRLKLS